jgi:hypothetical protein
LPDEQEVAAVMAVEQWLFFAEARHVISLFYGEVIHLNKKRKLTNG